MPLGATGDRNQTWQVPVCLAYPTGSGSAAADASAECMLLSDPRQTVTLRKARSCPAWINADAGGTGYYRVLYDGDLDVRLADQERLLPAERVDLLRNAQTLFDAGLIGPDKAIPTGSSVCSFPGQ